MTQLIDSSQKSRIKRWLPVILVGAIGSGLWSVVGDPFFSWLGSYFVSIASSFSFTYIDSLHSEIGKGLHESSAQFLKTLTYIWLLALYIFMIRISFLLKKHIKKRLDPKDTEEYGYVAWKDRGKRLLKGVSMLSIVVIILTVSFFLLATHVLVKDVYTNSAIVFTERSLDILAPVMTETERLKVRARYRSVENAEDFYELVVILREIASDNGTTLPKFESY